MIEFSRVSKRFQVPKKASILAVDDLSLTVLEGEVHCLLGTSGCGKTTTMKMVNRLVEPSEGTIFVDTENIQEVDVIELRRRIGYVIQTGGLFPHMTVGENVGLLCRLEKFSPSRTSDRVSELMDLVGLPQKEFIDRFPGELSGGQVQRVGVARALALDPSYMLMDEPFGALDPITKGQIHEQFLELQHRVKKTVILVTHDISEALTLGDRISLMDHGKLIQTGDPKSLLDSPANEFVSEFLAGHSSESRL